jgi:hypothetical protein
MTTGTLYINPDATADDEYMARAFAKERGVRVMPARPFPWNRKEYREIERVENGTDRS